MSTSLEDIYLEQASEDEYITDKIDQEVKKLIENQNSEYYLQSKDFFALISSSDLANTYQRYLIDSIKYELWEYGAVVIWKVIILFCYEKIFQINFMGLLDDKFVLPLKNVNRDCVESFSFNCIEDSKIIENLKLLWRNLDQNYQNMFQTLLHERNSLSHVNNYSYSEIKFKAFFEKSLELLMYLESVHLKRLSEIIKTISEKQSFPYLSEGEIKMFLEHSKNEKVLLYFLVSLVQQKLIKDEHLKELKNNAIDLFTTSNSFDISYKRALIIIKPLIPYFDKKDYTQILDLTCKNQIKNTVNQILHAGGIDNIFTQMYFESSNNFPDLENLWTDFYTQILFNKSESNFKNLIERMGKDL